MATDMPLLPGHVLSSERMPGHWLLARLGKRVLRPGGVELTVRLLSALAISDADDVVEVAPGLGATTKLVLASHPASYTGIDRDPDAAQIVDSTLGGLNRRVIAGTATNTGLPDDVADVAFGEAYLTMQPDSVKRQIIGELARILRPGGRFALHEVAFSPDDISEERRAQVASALTSHIKVNVTPMTTRGWETLLEDHGFTITSRFHAPLHLLEPRRLIADEGVVGAARFVSRVVRDGEARRRVLAMRQAMRDNSSHLQAYGLTATYG